MNEFVELETRAFRDNAKGGDSFFPKDALVYAEKQVVSIDKATLYFKSILGHIPASNCNCAPQKQNLPQNTYFAFPIDSEYGLNSCKEVVKGGEFYVDADAIRNGVLKPKPKTTEKKTKSAPAPDVVQ